MIQLRNIIRKTRSYFFFSKSGTATSDKDIRHQTRTQCPASIKAKKKDQWQHLFFPDKDPKHCDAVKLSVLYQRGKKDQWPHSPVNHALLSFMNSFHKCSVDIIFLLPKKSQWFFSTTFVLNSSSVWVLHIDNEADEFTIWFMNSYHIYSIDIIK